MVVPLDPLNRLVPERPVGVAAAPIQLLEHLNELKSLALAYPRDALPLQVRTEEAVSLAAGDAANADVT